MATLGDDAKVFDPAADLRAWMSGEDRRLADALDTLRGRYVYSDRDDRIAYQIKRLIMNAASRRDVRLPHSATNRRPGVGFAVIGESRSGKTTSLQRAFGNHQVFPGYGIKGSGCPLITVGAPSPCTLTQLAMSILDELGYAPERIPRENQAWRLARFHLKENRIQFVHIDDCQHVLHTIAEHEVQKFSDTLKNLMIDRNWPVQLILSGIPDLVRFLERDIQLLKRLRYVTFEDISVENNADFMEATVRDYAAKAGLNLTTNADDMLTGRLMHAGCRQMGLSIEILVEAIEMALTAGQKTLSIEDFADAFASHTLSSDVNPFLVQAWDMIDCRAIQRKREAENAASSQPASRRRTTRR